jgi:hypothetical protein
MVSNNIQSDESQEGHLMRSLLSSISSTLCIVVLVSCMTPPCVAELANPLLVTTFRCDMTPPLEQPLESLDRLRVVEQPLWAKGVILDARGQRYVLCALDWCELDNGAHEALVNAVAKAAGAEPSCVAIQTVHLHSAPLVDTDAWLLLASAGLLKVQIKPDVIDAMQERLAAAVQQSLPQFEPFNQIGTGQAKVDRVASSRRPVNAKNEVMPRFSTCKDPAVRDLPEGLIDPFLKTITFACDGKPLVRLHYYATHPQTTYGDGRASSDMVGDAREALEKKEGVFQIYFNGCGGDVTVGKYNDGSKTCRPELAQRLQAGMEASIAATTYTPVQSLRWQTCPVEFPRRTDAGFGLEATLEQIKNTKPDTEQCGPAGTAAIRAAFHQRKGTPIDLSVLEIGDVRIVHLPGEPMVEFQLFAQMLNSKCFVAVAGYGDCAPGYLCTERAFTEGGYEPTGSNVKPESEVILKQALTILLNGN